MWVLGCVAIAVGLGVERPDGGEMPFSGRKDRKGTWTRYTLHRHLDHVTYFLQPGPTS